MHLRRLTTFLLGCWLAGSLFMTGVAIQNFRGVERLLAAPAPGVQPLFQTLGTVSARQLLRYQAAEMNRFYFQNWELVQVGLGALVLVLLVLEHRPGLVEPMLAAVPLLIASWMHWRISPDINYLGRQLDFRSVESADPIRIQFWQLHNAYSGLQVGVLAILLVLTVKIILSRPKHRPHSDSLHTSELGPLVLPHGPEQLQ